MSGKSYNFCLNLVKFYKNKGNRPIESGMDDQPSQTLSRKLEVGT